MSVTRLGMVGDRGGEVQTSMTTMAREYMSDSFVTLIELGAGSEVPSNMDNRSGAIHLIDPALFTVDACADSASAVMDASPKSHRIALLLSPMRMLGCACSVSDVAQKMKFTYSFQVAVHHILRMKVAQATSNVYELRVGMVILGVAMDRR